MIPPSLSTSTGFVNPNSRIEAAIWASAYDFTTKVVAPDSRLGVYTVDELADIEPQGRDSDAAAPPPPAAPALPDYAADAFAKNLPLWTKLVADGKKTAPDLLATLSTKATFSEEQKARILSLKKATTAAPPPPAAPPADAQHAEIGIGDRRGVEPLGHGHRPGRAQRGDHRIEIEQIDACAGHRGLIDVLDRAERHVEARKPPAN